ncbi:MAG: helix-turn-helix domain-containing protein [Bacteroidota bacterium]|nr:helix-turn-helix domain-containing protein [Bacteroidota bacterium]
MNIIEQIEKAFKLHEQGFSLREIAKEIGVSKSTVDRWLKAENNDGEAETQSGTPFQKSYPPPHQEHNVQQKTNDPTHDNLQYARAPEN